jgi:hypothetical protein
VGEWVSWANKLVCASENHDIIWSCTLLRRPPQCVGVWVCGNHLTLRAHMHPHQYAHTPTRPHTHTLELTVEPHTVCPQWNRRREGDSPFASPMATAVHTDSCLRYATAPAQAVVRAPPYHTHTPLPVRCAMRIRCVSYTEGCLWIMGNARSLTSSSAPRPIMPIAQQPALALARASLAVASLDHRLRAIARHGTVGDKRGSPEYTLQWRPCKVRCPCCTRCYTQDCPAAHAVDVCLSNEPLVPPAQLLVGWLPAVDGGVVVVTGVRLTGDQREG